MSSPSIPPKTTAQASAKRTLQRLRREAGYRCAKDFARELGIPESTYARYERAAEGPACGIPLANAWAIADELGCTIDLVVGRESTYARTRDAFQLRRAALTEPARAKLDSYLTFLELTEGGR